MIDGATLNYDLNRIYSGEVAQKAAALAREIVGLQETGKSYEIQIRDRIYEITPNYIQYHSIKGQGKYHFLDSVRALYDFLAKPRKSPTVVRVLKTI